MLDLFLLIITFSLSTIFVNYFCSLKNIKLKFQNYSFSILSLIRSLKNKNFKNQFQLQKRLDEVSHSGILLILEILKFLIPYILCFSILFLRQFGNSFAILLLSSLPYIVLLKSI